MEIETEVTDIIQRTHNVKSFRFPRPESFDYKAGQFMFITIRSKEGEGELRKHFTISSSPTEEYIEFTKKLSDSIFSQTLKTLKVGDWAKIEGPHGMFTFEGEYTKIAMLSGGIGITPLRSMCRYCLDLKLDTDIVLLYCNRSVEDTAFREEFEDMQNLNKNLRVVFGVDEPPSGWTGIVGRINTEVIRTRIPDYAERVFYLCGPPPMVKAMDSLLTEIGIPQDNIKKENFYGYE